MNKLKVTLSGTNPLAGSDVFRLQRLMLYHPTAVWDPWHLPKMGGTLYGALTVQSTIAATGAISGTAGATVSLADAGVGTKALVTTLGRTGGSNATTTERMLGLAFSDGLNTTLTSGITGIRENPNASYLGGIGFFVHATSGTPATTFADLVEAARFNSTGDLVINTTTDASSSVTGSLRTAGGLGVAKKAFIGTDLTVGGNVNFTALPTSNPGVAGRLWNNGGVVQIS